MASNARVARVACTRGALHCPRTGRAVSVREVRRVRRRYGRAWQGPFLKHPPAAAALLHDRVVRAGLLALRGLRRFPPAVRLTSRFALARFAASRHGWTTVPLARELRAACLACEFHDHRILRESFHNPPPPGFFTARMVATATTHLRHARCSPRFSFAPHTAHLSCFGSLIAPSSALPPARTSRGRCWPPPQLHGR